MAKTYERKERESILLHCRNFMDVLQNFGSETALKIICQLIEYSDCEREGREFTESLSGPELFAFRLLQTTVNEGIGSFRRRQNAAIDARKSGQQSTTVDDGRPMPTTVDKINENEKESENTKNENEIFFRLRSFCFEHCFSFVSETDIRQWLKKYTEEEIKYALEETQKHGGKTSGYTTNILKSITREPENNPYGGV